jgi:hypothetical protein
VLGIVVVVLVLGRYGERWLDPKVFGFADYIAFWTAGRLVVTGGDPYAPDQRLPLQAELGWTESTPMMMWNPPWALPLFMPFGAAGFTESWPFWLFLLLGCILLSADRLWLFHGGPERLRPLAWLLGLTFFPALVVLQKGQTSPFVLLGVTGFLLCERKRHDLLAGACGVLVAVKPHLAYLFWLFLLVWAIDRRRWSILLGGALTGAAAVGVALLASPHVLDGYWRLLTTGAPLEAHQLPPTLGAVLRYGLGMEHRWLQFVPMLLALAWAGPYWWRQRRTWNWGEQLPLLLLLSLMTIHYGAWSYDMVILLVPLVQAAVWTLELPHRQGRSLAIAGYALGSGAAFFLSMRHAPFHWFVWIAPVFWIGYLWLSQCRRRELALSRCA